MLIGCLAATISRNIKIKAFMSGLSCSIRAAIVLGVVSAGILTSGCATKRGLSLVDYQSVKAAQPPQTLATLWAGPLPGGTLLVEVFRDGRLRSCLSAPPYYHQMAGKYSEQAFYFEDGSRIEIEASNNGHEITIYSPPGNPLARLTPNAGGLEAADCFARAPIATH